MARGYVYEREHYDGDEDGRLRLARALVMNEPGVVDDYDFECWVNNNSTASGILWMVKEWGYDETIVTLWSDFEEWYAEEHVDDLLRDFSYAYEVEDDDDVEDDEE